jgi:hypothetical protein
MYKVGIGHNVPLDDLVDVKAASTGIQAANREYPVNGGVYDDAEYVILNIANLEDAAMYQAELAKFGLDDAKFANVTVYVRDDQWAWVRKNGIAKRPEQGRDARWRNLYPGDIAILITDLEDPS